MIILIWILTGVALDALLMYLLYRKDFKYWTRYMEIRGLHGRVLPDNGFTYQIKECHWWAHLMMVAFWPFALSFMQAHLGED